MSNDEKHKTPEKHSRIIMPGETEEIEEEPTMLKGPVKAVAALFILMLIVLFAVPYYSIKMSPEPKSIPTIAAVQAQIPGISSAEGSGWESIREAEAAQSMNDPRIKQAANIIAAESCTESRLCHAKAIYYFVRDSIKYISDPHSGEYIASPAETLKTGGGDCEDGAILLSALLGAVGIKNEIVLIPGHALLRAEIPEAPLRQRVGNWVYMEWTCRVCSFGEIPYSDIEGVAAD